MAEKRKKEKRREIKKVNWFIVCFIIFFILLTIFFVWNANKIPDGFYPIQIFATKKPIAMPGVAIVKNGKDRFFTVAHWFPFGTNDQYFLVFRKQKLWIEKIQYLGNDRIELFCGKANFIPGCASDNDSGWENNRQISLDKPIRLTSLIDGTSYDFTERIKIKNIDQEIDGFGMSSETPIFQRGQSGSPFIDQESNIYLFSLYFAFKDVGIRDKKESIANIVVKIDY